MLDSWDNWDNWDSWGSWGRRERGVENELRRGWTSGGDVWEAEAGKEAGVGAALGESKGLINH
jgi:hypothetical protein